MDADEIYTTHGFVMPNSKMHLSSAFRDIGAVVGHAESVIGEYDSVGWFKLSYFVC